MEDVFFIDRNGNRIYNDEIASHIGLAISILNQNHKLNEEYKKSGKNDPIDFLLNNKGYLKFSDIGYYRKCVYYSDKISDEQKRLIEYYRSKGYDIDDLSIIDLEKEKGEQR